MSPGASYPASRSQKLVLVADDDPAVHSWIESTAPRGFRIVAVSTVKAALFQAYVLEPDALVLDVALGNEDGITAARELRRIFPAAPIVFISAVVRPGLLQHVEMGWPKPEFLAKPLQADAFWGLLRGLLPS